MATSGNITITRDRVLDTTESLSNTKINQSTSFTARVGEGQIDSRELAAGVRKVATGTLSSAQILSANSSPVTLVTAQGASTVIVVESVALFLDFNSTAYVSANAGEVRYSGGNAVTQDVAAAFLTSTSDAYYTVAPAGTVVAAANTAVVFTVASADPTAGDSPINYAITYRVADFS